MMTRMSVKNRTFRVIGQPVANHTVLQRPNILKCTCMGIITAILRPPFAASPLLAADGDHWRLHLLMSHSERKPF